MEVSKGGKTSNRASFAGRTPHKTVSRNAHRPYAGKPRFNQTVTVLPAKYTTVYYGPTAYYYTGGMYYAPYGGGYRIVRPHRGVTITVLPFGYSPIYVGPTRYYYYYGTYYSSYGGSYIVVDPPIGAVVQALPDGYLIRTYDGYEYYYLDGVYYTQVDYPSYPGGIGYMVVTF
ncbi:MAG: DUF6515 family protein [Sphingobacteriales bacterium JAD_PAG50586_3]|nr:MAG: DUF6515 family protein [Sphingobacteriales bacterium JAD_PAG50586_3]